MHRGGRLRRIAPAVFATLALVSLAGCTDSSPLEDAADEAGDAGDAADGLSPVDEPVVLALVQAPVYGVGDRWTDSITADDGTGTEALLTGEVVALETVEVDGQDVEAVRIATTIAYSEGSNATMTLWQRASDGALLRTEVMVPPLDDHGHPDDTAGDHPHETQAIATTFDRPCVIYEWPLVVGKMWTSECAATMHQPDGTNFTTHKSAEYLVLAAQRIEVAGRSVEAIQVRVDMAQDGVGTGTQIHWVPDAGCHPVLVESVGDVRGLRIENLEFSCSSSA